MKTAGALALFTACLWAQTPASVEGTAVNALTGDPIRYAHISLRAGEQGYGAISTTEGHFAIAPIAAGSYQLTASANGYLAPTPQALELKPDDHKRDLVVKLLPGGVIAGRVLDRNGDPLEAYEVAAIRGEQAGSADTNDLGEFRIAGLRPGKYLLRASNNTQGSPPEVRSDGSKEVYYGPEYYPGVVSLSMALTVEARAGAETTGIDIRLTPQPRVRVSGTVTGLTFQDNQGGQVLGDDGEAARIQRGGSFTLWGLSPGPHQLTAERRALDDSNLRSAPTDIVVGDVDLDRVELRILPPFEVSGRIAPWNGPAGRLTLDPLGRTGEKAAGEIAADGTFRLEKVQPDRYRVAIANLPPEAYLKRLGLGAVEMPDGVLDLRGGAANEPVAIGIGAGAARVTGMVSDANGPAAGALVALFPEGPHANELRVVTHAKSDGSYAIGGLAPGKYTLLALAADEPEATAQFDEKLDTVDLAEGQPAAKDLKVTKQ